MTRKEFEEKFQKNPVIRFFRWSFVFSIFYIFASWAMTVYDLNNWKHCLYSLILFILSLICNALINIGKKELIKESYGGKK